LTGLTAWWQRGLDEGAGQHLRALKLDRGGRVVMRSAQPTVADRPRA